MWLRTYAHTFLKRDKFNNRVWSKILFWMQYHQPFKVLDVEDQKLDSYNLHTMRDGYTFLIGTWKKGYTERK